MPCSRSSEPLVSGPRPVIRGARTKTYRKEADNEKVVEARGVWWLIHDDLGAAVSRVCGPS